MTETTRIRWRDDDDGGFAGTVGTAKAFTFTIWPPGEDGAWLLVIFFAGHNGSCITCQEPAAGPDELKRAAEDWLAGFVSSLGAVFGDAIAADLRSRADDLEAMVCREPGQERDNLLFSAGLKRAADLIEHGDIPGTTAATAGEE